MVQYIKRNEKRIVINTPTGPRAFSGMSKTWHKQVLKVTVKGTFFKVGLEHIFLCEDGWKRASSLKVGDLLVREDHSVAAITSIEKLPGEFLYDFLDVDGGSAYIANGFIHHNCEFLSSDALLINSMKLVQLAPANVDHEDMGFKFWKPADQIGGLGKTYLVGVDPSTGSGKDFSVIEVFEFPSLEQVAEWRSNDINIPLLYAKVKWVLEKLSVPINGRRAEVLWSFERNGIGEALSALYQNDEKQPEYAELYNDQPNNPNKLGVFTSGKSKVLACLQLKSLVEKTTNGLQIKSAMLLEELKNFVAKGGTYEAKSGSTDDCVMATVIIVRLLKRLSEYNDDAFKQVNEYVSPDENGDQFGDEPVPFML